MSAEVENVPHHHGDGSLTEIEMQFAALTLDQEEPTPRAWTTNKLISVKTLGFINHHVALH